MFVFSILFCVVIGLLTYLLVLWRRRLNYWKSIGIACEEPHPFLGNLTGIRTTRAMCDIWNSYYERFRGTGPFAGFYWGLRPSVFVLDRKLAKDILIKEFNKFTDRGFYSNEKDDPLSGQLFLLDGQRWRNMRNKLSPTFTSGKMKLMFPLVIEVANKFVTVVGEMVDKNPIVEVKDILARFTMDVIGICAFGLECNSLTDPKAEFLKMGRKSLVEQRHALPVVLFMSSFPELARKFHFRQTHPDVEKFFMGVVHDTVAYREKNNVQRNDFMGMLIDLKNNKSMKSEDGELTALTMGQLAAQAMVFLVAGFETSSTTMGFALYELAQHQEIQQRARDEVNAVLEKHNHNFTYECLSEMQYINQIISETLRLYTVVPILNRFCLEDYVVPDNPRYVIKKGLQIIIPAGAMHRDPDIYPNPNEFNPDNFTPEKVSQRDSTDWLPFGDGPRNCIGMRFGLMQTRIGLSLLLKNFKFSICEKTQIPLQYDKTGFMLSAEEGIYLKLQRI